MARSMSACVNVRSVLSLPLGPLAFSAAIFSSSVMIVILPDPVRPVPRHGTRLCSGCGAG